MPRPSALPALAACPRWVSRPRTEAKDSLDEAADEGTAIHAKMEALAGIPVSQWDDDINGDAALGPALIPIVREAADQVRDVFSMGLPVVTKARLGLGEDSHYELGCVLDDGLSVQRFHAHASAMPVQDAVYCECGLDSGIAAPGTGDVAVVQGNRGFYIDYKSNRVARDHRPQVLAYVVGLFNAVARLETVEARVVAPRLYGVHAPEVFSRGMLPQLEAELRAITGAAADPFTPGCPGEYCAMCAGNGRCPYQAAALRDIPVAAEALVRPQAWTHMLDAVTPDLRGQRRALVKWLETFVDAVKDDDKAWALANPEAEIPGFAKTVQAGRACFDRTRCAEAVDALCLKFGLGLDVIKAFAVVDASGFADYLALNRGTTKAEAEAEVKAALAPYMKRGADIVAFRAVKAKKAKPALTA